MPTYDKLALNYFLEFRMLPSYFLRLYSRIVYWFLKEVHFNFVPVLYQTQMLKAVTL